MTGDRSTRPSRRRVLLTAVLAVVGLAVTQTLTPTNATADPTPTTTVSTTWMCSVLNIGCPTTTTPTTAPSTTTSVTVPTTTVAPDCGGTATIPKPGGGTWSCTFSDEFAGTALDPAKWIPTATTDPSGASLQTGTTHGDACIVNSPNNVSVSGGSLRLTARNEPAPVTCKVGQTTLSKPRSTGEVSTWKRLEQTYGRFEIRAKLPTMTVKGLQTAFWMWPTNTARYPESNEEIDIAEMYSQYPTLVIPYLHYNSVAASRGVPVTNRTFSRPDLDQFHTYVLEWTTTNLKITFDGDLVLDHPIQPNPLFGRAAPEPFDRDFFLILSQGLGVSTNSYQDGTNGPATPLPATTEVDYVRVWG
jgi:beta-glucanase (GH16 family)